MQREGVLDDLGSDTPCQVILAKYLVSLFSGKKRSFSSNWFKWRNWLEYSVKANALFCFACRKFGTCVVSDPTFTTRGFQDWKHTLGTEKRLEKHARSKEISTLLNNDQLQRNHNYLSSIIDMIEFLCGNQLPLRGHQDTFSSLSDGGSGLFLSLFEYTLRKHPELKNAVKTIPSSATYSTVATKSRMR